MSDYFCCIAKYILSSESISPYYAVDNSADLHNRHADFLPSVSMRWVYFFVLLCQQHEGIVTRWATHSLVWWHVLIYIQLSSTVGSTTSFNVRSLTTAPGLLYVRFVACPWFRTHRILLIHCLHLSSLHAIFFFNWLINSGRRRSHENVRWHTMDNVTRRIPWIFIHRRMPDCVWIWHKCK